MPLRIQLLQLNDLPHDQHSVIPTERQICDAILVLWKQEPILENSSVDIIQNKLKENCPYWQMDHIALEDLMLRNNLYAVDESKLSTFGKFISFPPDLPTLKHKNVYIDYCKLNDATNKNALNRGLFAKRSFEPGDIIFQEDKPIVTIPPLEKLKLIEMGKCCASCGHSMNNISQRTILLQSLDCNDCNVNWCTANCKKQHQLLHNLTTHGRRSTIPKNWKLFLEYCKSNLLIPDYSVGVLLTFLHLNKLLATDIKKKFNSLCQVSQLDRLNSSDSLNIGGTLDASNRNITNYNIGVVGTNDKQTVASDINSKTETNDDSKSIFNEQCAKSLELLLKLFPDLEEELSKENFLNMLGRFNINKISNQLYYLTSFINHNCEPNVRFEIMDNLQIKLFARRKIQENEQLFITYVNPLHGVKLRRRELRVNYGFLCHCHRCKNELIKYKTISDNMKKPKDVKKLSVLSPPISEKRRKSSMRNRRPDLQELLKNGKEFELEIPDEVGIGRRRRTSVRFNESVSFAVEE